MNWASCRRWQLSAGLRVERYRDKKFGAQIVSSIFPLHSGSYFGLVGVILFLLASLAITEEAG